MFRFLSELILVKILKWQVTGWRAPVEAQHVMVALPHTSNWDFPVGVLARSILGTTHIKFIGKASLFIPPFGWIFRALGGYPVERGKNNGNYVQNVAEIFKKDPTFSVCIAPEGTRKYTTKLKTGFYYIAKEANVPLSLAKFDFGKKIVDFSEPYYLTGDFDTDMAYIVAYFQGVEGLNYTFDMQYPWKED
jgi:1-acyl-sn-glycerol-3-phosphate acyltransferase